MNSAQDSLKNNTPIGKRTKLASQTHTKQYPNKPLIIHFLLDLIYN